MQVLHQTIHQIMELKKGDSEEIRMKGTGQTFSEDSLTQHSADTIIIILSHGGTIILSNTSGIII